MRRYNDKTGHFEVYCFDCMRWVDLYTCDQHKASKVVQCHYAAKHS